MTTYEVTCEPPYLYALSPYKPVGLHQGFSFLPKNACDVRKVEFAKAYRLTDKTIEPVSFTVPRVKTNFFQGAALFVSLHFEMNTYVSVVRLLLDDIFPPTKALWEPAISAEEWFSGKDRLVDSLQAFTCRISVHDMSNVILITLRSPRLISLKPEDMKELNPPGSTSRPQSHRS